MSDPTGFGTVALLLEQLVTEVQGLRMAMEAYSKLGVVANTSASETEGLLDVKTAATLCGVSRTTIYRALERGDLSCLRAGARVRFARADLDAWLRGERPEQARVLSLRGKKGL